MKFEDYNISHHIKKNLLKMGIRKPTDIQFKSIPHILKGEDILAIAQTGTGKTAAFAIPVLSTIAYNKKNERRPDGIKCLVMVPTRELAAQLTTVFNEIADHTGINIMYVHGGVDQEGQIENLQAGVDVLIATPGRMFDLISQGYIKLNRVQTLILDEADHMLDLGFIKDIRDVLRFLPSKRQTLFFSATITPSIKKMAYSVVQNKAVRIQVSPKNPVARTVEHTVAFVQMDDKRYFLDYLINSGEYKKILVFVRTKVRAGRVQKAMERVGIATEVIHGEIEQKERSNLIDRFSTTNQGVLITTDVSSRGLDIPNVDLVINYDMPDKPENYVHRCGRTGRGNNRGVAIGFCSEEEEPILGEIETYMGKKVDVMEINRSEYLNVVDSSIDNSFGWRKLIKENEDLDIFDQVPEGKRKAKKKRKK